MGGVNSPSLQENIREEHEVYRDIIQDDSFLDDYYNLTAKAISMLKWATIYCKGAEGIFRGADDTWLNQEKALDLLTSNYGREGIYGFLATQYQPMRVPNTKGFMPIDRYNWTLILFMGSRFS